MVPVGDRQSAGLAEATETMLENLDAALAALGLPAEIVAAMTPEQKEGAARKLAEAQRAAEKAKRAARKAAKEAEG